MIKFVHSVLTFYKIASSQLSAIVWCTVLGFKALYALFTPEACEHEIFSTAYALKRTPHDARYFVP